LDKDEVKQMNTDLHTKKDDTGLPISSPGLELLGFKPQSYLKPYHYVQPGLFAYPEEKLVQGSAKLFRALLERCAARKVMAIGKLVARGNTKPRLVALLPQMEETDESGYQSSPPGFHIIYLPFADDIRDLQKVTEQQIRVKPSVDQVEKARAVVRNLKSGKYDYNPENFPNPALQKHYRAIEAIALDRDSVEEVKDMAEPDYDWMERKAKQQIDDFVKSVFSEGYAAGSKRKAAGGDAASKKAKAEGIILEDEARASRLEKLTVPVLRELAGQANIKLSGTRKADIIQQINRHFGV